MLASIVWDVDPTIFEIAGREIRWYGLMWGLGFILAYKYAEWLLSVRSILKNGWTSCLCIL